MNRIGKLIAGILILGFSAAALAGPAPTTSGFTDQQIIQSWGWIFAHDKDLAQIEISDAELSIFLQGLRSRIKDEPSPCNLRNIYPDIQNLAQARREKLLLAQKQKNLLQANAFLAELKTRRDVLELSDGLRCQIVKPGVGPHPKPRQTVSVHYVARLLDGVEYVEFGPIDIILVPAKVSPGWMAGITKIGAGGAIKLFLSPPIEKMDVARNDDIPPGAAMIVDIDLLAVRDTTPQEMDVALTPPPPELPPPPPSGYTTNQVIQNWGWYLGKSLVPMNSQEAALFIDGLTMGIRGKPAPCDLDRITHSVEQFVNDRRQKERLAFRQQQLAKMTKLFAELKKDPTVIELPSGLRYQIIKPGNGPSPRPGQIVNMNYVGRLIDGTIFDQTTNEPLNIQVGTVLDGWTQGLQKINKGGKIKLYIPPDLGYGDEPTTGVPPTSTLIYDIELLDIKDAPPATP